jgi:hypothetical protein
MSDMKFKPDEQRALVGTVRDLVRTIQRRVMKWQDGTFPWENMHDREDQRAQISIPEAARPRIRHCARSRKSRKILLRDLNGVDGRVSAGGNHHVHPEDEARHPAPVCSGESLLAVCMTKPHAGFPTSRYLRTNTTIKGDRATVKSVKTLISRATTNGSPAASTAS